MLILLFGIIVISTINTGFAQHTTLLIFTISLQFMMLLLISITSISPLTKHSIHNNSCCIHLKYSSYTICIGIVLFYVLIHYSIAGTFTTDSFLLYLLKHAHVPDGPIQSPSRNITDTNALSIPITNLSKKRSS
eukprot:699003_1